MYVLVCVETVAGPARVLYLSVPLYRYLCTLCPGSPQTGNAVSPVVTHSVQYMNVHVPVTLSLGVVVCPGLPAPPGGKARWASEPAPREVWVCGRE